LLTSDEVKVAGAASARLAPDQAARNVRSRRL